MTRYKKNSKLSKKKLPKTTKKGFNKIDDAYFKRTGKHKPGRKSAITTHDRLGKPLPKQIPRPQ